MSHHQRNKKLEMVEEKTRQRRHSHHGHLHRKPTSVIDHLKTKVKRKKLTQHDSSALSDGSLNQNVNSNNNSNTKGSNQDHVDCLHETTLTSAKSHPNISSTTLSNKLSFEENDFDDNNENHEIIEKDEQDSVVPNGKNEDEDLEENAQWQTNPIISDTYPKMYKLKPKSVKPTKSLLETNNQSNAKKRRQKVRRTGFQIRDEDFNIIFSDLPSDEQLIIAYPCAWRRDVFVHGRMFLSANYLCFYTCFFKWEESLCISYKDIINVTREKSAKVLPNAIKLRTKNQEQYIFVSTLPREKIFVAIFRLWQNALRDQPLPYQQVRTLVYADQQRYDESTGDSDGSITLENTGEDPAESGIYSQSLPITSDRSTESPIEPVGIKRRVVSLPLNNEINTYLSSCSCESHLAKNYADRLITLNVDTVFELLFGDNSFTSDYHNSQKLSDYVYGEWRLNKETGQRERQVTYKAMTQSMLGSNLLSCREKQILEVEKPNLIYVLSSEVYNEGMKYTDAFYVATRFCITQRDAEHSALRVTAEIRYLKNVNSIVKSFIERNANTSIEEGINEQVRRLENHQIFQVNRKSNKKRTLASKQQLMNNNISENQIENTSLISSQSKLSIEQKSMTGKGIFYDLALLIGIVLLILHIYLCYKTLFYQSNSINT